MLLLLLLLPLQLIEVGDTILAVVSIQSNDTYKTTRVNDLGYVSNDHVILSPPPHYIRVFPI